MNDGLIPQRYAKALYKHALEKGVDKRIYQLAGNLADAFAAQPALGEAMANPFVSNTDKQALLTTAAQATDADSVFDSFTKLLANNNRLEFARTAAIAYRKIYRDANNIRQVKVVSAQPLEPADQKRLQSLIEKHLNGASMEYTALTDPRLIGGFTVAIDNERLDASIANDLKQLSQSLIS